MTGDQAGAAITQFLTACALKTPSIRILSDVCVVDLIQHDGRITGAMAVSSTSPARVFSLVADATVLATGGAAGLYAVSTTPLGLMGTGLGLAARAGAVVADAEFMQFHPTGMMLGGDPTPLATEALRGEGATLITQSGERFMRGVHEDAELAPRDVVARAVHHQIQKGNQVFLDCRSAIGPQFESHFPTVYGLCRDAGLDPVHEPIPVAPAAHYHMGGIATDLNGRTSLKGLWACGEVASTGLHGANRLASNSLAEALVMGEQTAASLCAETPAHPSLMTDRQDILPPLAPPPGAVIRLRQTMTRHVGLIRSAASLSKAASIVRDMEAGCASLMLANALAAATMIIAAASLRQESRGGHFRSDYPMAHPTWRRRSHLTLTQTHDHLRDLAARETQSLAHDHA